MNNEHERLYALTEHILGLMQKNKGPIPFSDWMHAALYQAKLGYYESEKIFGEHGDFITATAMGDWLALGFAETIKKSWHALGQPTSWALIEQGGGSGDLMLHTLTALSKQGLQPNQIIAVETSQQLRSRQQEKYANAALNVQQVASLRDIATIDTAIMFSNELPDAFPLQTFSYQDGKIIERGVDWDGKTFIWQNLQEISAPIDKNIQQQWGNGYISEINPHLQTWQQDISNIFKRGVVLTVDYGYTQQEYYRATRIEGTLMGHYKHQVVDDVLKLSPGVCDITAHVDFSALCQAGNQVALEPIAYTSQGAWLAQSDIVQQHIQSLAANPSVDNIAKITQAKRLLLPTGMGESFKLFIQGKGLSKEHRQTLISPAFDRLHTL